MTRKPLTSVTVVGLGPAGRIAAHRAAATGARVRAFDPTGGQLPSTIGVWEHQLPQWAPEELVKVRFAPRIVLHDGSCRALNATYCVVDNSVLDNLGGFEIVKKRYDGSTDADLVIAATGGSAKAPIRQIAYGQIFPEESLADDVRHGVLMDFRKPSGLPAGSFSYRVPLGDGTWLIEETILATRLGTSSAFETGQQALDWLRNRQSQRLKDLGVTESAAIDEEVVSFPLLPAATPTLSQLLKARRRGMPIPFGQAGGWMHPATGYSVGTVLESIDNFLAARGSAPPGDIRLWRLRRRGLAALLSFSAEQQSEFFAAFFQLPEEKIFSYLTGASASETLRAMVGVAKPLAQSNRKVLMQLVRGFCFGGKWRAESEKEY